jgi:uncharacterized protein
MLAPIADPAFYLVAVAAVLLVGISKGGFGGGGLFAVPAMALIVPPAQAAAIMLPILLIMDGVGVHAYRRRFDRGAMLVMLPGAVLGIAAGGFAFGLLDPDAMRLLIGALALGFVAWEVLGRGRLRPPARPRTWLGALCGAISGFTSTIAHAGGPPAALYLLPLRLDKTVFVGSTVIFFGLVNLMKLVPYALLGQFTTVNLATSLVLAPLAPLGVRLGVRLHHRISQATFYPIIYGIVALTGAKLIWDGLGG